MQSINNRILKVSKRIVDKISIKIPIFHIKNNLIFVSRQTNFLLFVCLRAVSCVPRVANVSGLFILGCSSVFSTFICFSSSCVLCAAGCQCLWIVHSCLLLGFLYVYLLVLVLCLVCRWLPVSLDCSFLVASSVFSNVYLFVFVLCLVCLGLPMSLDCPFLFSPRFSLTFICLSSSFVFVPRVANVSGLIGSYIRFWERPGDLPRVIEILCLFASGAQRNEREDTTISITSGRSPGLSQQRM